MNGYEVEVKVPASTANLGPGFDSVGMALQLYTKIKMKKSDRTKFHIIGNHGSGAPVDKTNLIYVAAKFLYEVAGLPEPELEVEVESEIPLARGLGSSGAVIVGGLLAANVLAGGPFTRDEIFQLAAEMEGHPDNVGASLYGGNSRGKK